MNMPPHQQRPRGFTLLELLVAVAIVAILAALLLPTVNSMVSASKAAACVSNLRTLGAALQTYIAENDGRFPPSRDRKGNDGNGKPAGQNHWIFSHYYGRMASPSTEGLAPITYFSGPEPSALNVKRYQDAGIFWCPADNDPEKRPVNYAANSYTDNAYYIGGETAFSTDAVTGTPKPNNDYIPSHSRLSAVPRPGQILYAIDHINPSHIMRQSPITHQSWPLMAKTASKERPPNTTGVAFERHGGKANALFLDGSVRTLTFEDLAGTGARYLDPAKQQ